MLVLRSICKPSYSQYGDPLYLYKTTWIKKHVSSQLLVWNESMVVFWHYIFPLGQFSSLIPTEENLIFLRCSTCLFMYVCKRADRIKTAGFEMQRQFFLCNMAVGVWAHATQRGALEKHHRVESQRQRTLERETRPKWSIARPRRTFTHKSTIRESFIGERIWLRNATFEKRGLDDWRWDRYQVG